jgi:hypothetical protein
MRKTKIHLMDLVRRHQAESAEWRYVENADHATRGVMCWQVTLINVRTYNAHGSWRKIASHTFNLANGAELITDEYVANQVLKRLDKANDLTAR